MVDIGQTEVFMVDVDQTEVFMVNVDKTVLFYWSTFTSRKPQCGRQLTPVDVLFTEFFITPLSGPLKRVKQTTTHFPPKYFCLY